MARAGAGADGEASVRIRHTFGLIYVASDRSGVVDYCESLPYERCAP
jgi:hypothetical protein